MTGELRMARSAWMKFRFSNHFAGYFKNEKKEKKEKERKRERVTGSQQLISSSYIISVQVIKCSENLTFSSLTYEKISCTL